MSTEARAAHENDNPADPRAAQSAPTDRSAEPERINILLVDDEPKNLTVLESVLNNPGYRLVRAESADEALLALVAEEFALLVLDIQMPGMNGFELAQMVKGRKKTAGVPIIFLTAYYSEDQHVLEGYGSGAVDYLHKPINPAILQSKVAIFADLHRKNRALAAANRALLAEITERKRAQEELHELTRELERRIFERTSSLARANAALLEGEVRLKEASRNKDEFLATLAHELRNPLAPIRNAVQILNLKGLDTPELQWAKDVIDRQVRHMTRLVDDLLDVSRITTGKLTLRVAPVELQTIIQSAVETSRPLIEEFGHALTVKIPSRPAELTGDATRLAQVFSNLLNNAAKYTERGGAISLTAECSDDRLTVSVKDNGVGIASEVLPHVFEMFTQGQRHLERSHGGLGVGLTLVKRLVELHGGSVEARSEGLGKGSEFIVRLHLRFESRATARNDVIPDNSETAAPLRILVVDDNEDNAESLRRVLMIEGHEIQVAHDGVTGIEIAEAFRPNVVLLDIGMPRLNGYDACRRIREQPWGQDMLLIAQTGWGQDEDRRQTRAAGFDHHLIKPVNHADLMKLLAQPAAGRTGQSKA